MSALKNLTLTLVGALVAILVAGDGVAASKPLRRRPDLELCRLAPRDVLVRAGVGRITSFIEPPEQRGASVCYQAALALAIDALLSVDDGDQLPAVALDRGLACDAACWLDRETAAIAGPEPGDIWPTCPGAAGGDWLFFVASPDLSPRWYWVAVEDELDDDGMVEVRLWSEP